MASFVKLRQIVEELRAEGFSVTARARSDGSIIITSISGQKFKGAEGNTLARQLTGNTLPEEFKKQLESIKPPKGVSPQSRKEIELPPLLIAQIKKAQKVWRAEGMAKKGRGTITTPRVRDIYKSKGFKEATNALTEKIKYAQGIAYSKNVEIQAAKLEALANQLLPNPAKRLRKLAQYLRDNAARIKEKELEQLIIIGYTNIGRTENEQNAYIENLEKSINYTSEEALEERAKSANARKD